MFRFLLSVGIFIGIMFISGCGAGGNPLGEGYTVTVLVSPEGSGQVSVTPQKSSYESGEKVTVTAVANDNYRFDHWEGDAGGQTGFIELNVTQNLSIKAVFVESPGTAGLKIAEETVVLSPSIQITQGDNGQVTLTGEGLPTTIIPGSLVVSSRGTGSLFRVISVTSGENGSLVLGTQPAAITDVIQSGEVVFKNTFDLTKAVQAGGGGAVVAKFPAAKVGFENGKLTLSGTKLELKDIGNVTLEEFTLGFSPDIDFALRIQKRSVQEFKCIVGGNFDMHLLASINSAKISDMLKEETTVISLESSPSVIMVGYVPVVYQFVFETKLGGEMKVGNVGTVKGGFDLTTGISTGIQYINKQWNPYFDYRFDPTPFVEQWSIKPITVQVYVEPSVGVKFYGVVGPKLAVKPYMKGVGDFRYNELGAELRAGVSSDVGMEFKIIDGIEFSFTQELFDVSKVLAARLAFAEAPADLGNYDMNPKPGPLGFYLFTQPVTLTAMATQGNELAGWSLRHLCDSDSEVKQGNPLLNLPIDASKLISVGFVPAGYGGSWSGAGSGSGNPAYTLTTEVFPAGAGTIRVFPQEDKYKSGVNVLTTVTANPNFEFHHWERDLSGTELTKTVLMQGNRTIRAVFSSTVPRELNVPSQYGTIQAALDAATYNDKVILAAGTYSGTGNRDLDFHQRNISLIGAGMDQSIIDLSGSGTGDKCLTNLEEINNFKFSDLTVQNGSWPKIGILRLNKLKNFSLENCKFSGCTAVAVRSADCEGLVLKNCKFTVNNYTFPVVDVKDAQVIGCIFDGNKACPLAAENTTISGGNFTQNTGADKSGGITATNCKISSCTFSGNQGTCGAIIAETSEIADCQFGTNIGTGSGGAIKANQCQILRCSFTGNTSQGRGGGAIDTNDSDAITGIQDCEFTGNYSKSSGGGAINGHNFAVLNCTFTQNKTDKNGGAVDCQSNGSIGNCTFSANEAGTTCGAIDGNKMTIQNCEIKNNKSQTGYGGANLANSTMNFCTIDGNTTATGNVGGLNIANGYLFNSTITNNKVLAEGSEAGGLRASDQSIILLCTLSNNSLVGKIQSGGGGGAYIEHSYVNSCKFENNTVTDGPGGGLVARSSALVNCRITGNSCLEGTYKSAIVLKGGGAYLYDSEIYSSPMTGNQSGSDGGGIYLEGTETSAGVTHGLIQDCTVRSNQARNHGGIYAVRGTVKTTTISENTADYVGGLSAVGTKVTGCFVLTNTSPKGAGLNANGINNLSSVIENTEIANNSSSGGLIANSSTVTNCNIHDNTPWNQSP
jgi:hypothetical protein